MMDRQIHPFNTCGVQPPREAYPRPRSLEICLCPQAHHVRDLHQLAPPGALFHLAIYEASRHLPLVCFPPLARHLEPLSKMGWKGRKVQVSPIAGEEREAAGSQRHALRPKDPAHEPSAVSTTATRHGRQVSGGTGGCGVER